MAIKTQGTRLYVIDPGLSGPVSDLNVGCVTSIDGIDTTIEQLETTCLESPARTYVSGLATPGSATFTIQFDPSDASHVRMHELRSEEHTSELQSRGHLVCRLLLEKKKKTTHEMMSNNGDI